MAGSDSGEIDRELERLTSELESGDEYDRRAEEFLELEATLRQVEGTEGSPTEMQTTGTVTTARRVSVRTRDVPRVDRHAGSGRVRRRTRLRTRDDGLRRVARDVHRRVAVSPAALEPRPLPGLIRGSQRGRGPASADRQPLRPRSAVFERDGSIAQMGGCTRSSPVSSVGG